VAEHPGPPEGLIGEAPGAMTIEFLAGKQPKRRAPSPLVDVERKLILFWMHRCGSTASQLWFFQMAGLGRRMAGKGASELAKAWYAEHENLYRDLEPYYADPSFLKVAVIRNPLERAVSAFSVVTDTISGSQWRAVERSIANPDPDRRLTFLEFLDFLELNDLAAANYHWRLQTAQDWYDRALPDVQFVRVESLQDDLARMSARLGLRKEKVRPSSATTKIERNLRGLDVKTMTRADLARVFGRDRRGVIRFPDYSHFLDAGTTARLKSLYARDFDVLGY
jgi:hypothetical protein